MLQQSSSPYLIRLYFLRIYVESQTITQFISVHKVANDLFKLAKLYEQ